MKSVKKKQLSWVKRFDSFMRMENYKNQVTSARHFIPLDELCAELKTDPITGLTTEQVIITRMKTGPNSFAYSKKRRNRILVYCHSLFKGFSPMVWMASILIIVCAFLNYFYFLKHNVVDQFVLGFSLLFLDILSSTIEYFEDLTSDKFLEHFNSHLPQTTSVIRNGIKQTILVKNIVEGDLVDLSVDSVIPAGLRIIESQGLKVDNFQVNGTVESQILTATPTDENYLKSLNVGFFTANVLEGSGKGIVISCGHHTVIGRLAYLTDQVKPSKASLKKDIEFFVLIVSIWSILLGVISGHFFYFFNTDASITNALIFVSNVILSNVPEGFTQTVKLSLILGSRKIQKLNCYIKHCESIISLGATSVICTSKTGTITQNSMKIEYYWYSGEPVSAREIKESEFNKGFRALIRAAALSNKHQVSTPATFSTYRLFSRRSNSFAPSTTGTTTTSTTSNYNDMVDFYRNQFNATKLLELSFNFTTEIQTNVYCLEDERCIVILKGAPEAILKRCSTILWEEDTIEFSDKLRDICLSACASLAEINEKVFAFCDLELDETYTRDYPFNAQVPNFPRKNMRFLGFISIIDPLREDVADTINKCKTAGVKVTLLTGDHILTAKHVAQKAGILTKDKIKICEKVEELHELRVLKDLAIIVHGDILDNISNKDLDNLLANCDQIIFARMSSTQKLKVVEGYQRLGEIVTMTGDDVNDAPALKKADVGIAMGNSRSQVVQRASDIIFMNGQYSILIEGIKQGRKCFDNLKKTVIFKLTSNMAQITPSLAHSFMGLPQPMNVYAFLFIDILTDLMPSISLIFENEENDILQRPPRNVQRDRLVSRKLFFLAYGHLGLIESLAGFFTYFLVMAEHGFFPLQLFFIRDKWESPMEIIVDKFGQHWTLIERQELEYVCGTAFTIAVVVTQFANVVACKTRLLSVIQQKMTNTTLNLSYLVVTAICLIFVYCPVAKYLKLGPLLPRWWFYGIPFAIYLLMFDEFRKWHIRKFPKGWFYRETFY